MRMRAWCTNLRSEKEQCHTTLRRGPDLARTPRSQNLSHPATCPHGRQYCARRMQRLRKVLNFVHWESGKGKSKFMQREISEETVVDERYLELVLFKAERCWAYAMQLRDPPGGVPVCTN